MSQSEQQTKKFQQLAEARNALAATGKSPRQIGDESRRKIVDWIYRWGYTSPSLIQQLLGRTSGGYARNLARQGWLVSTKTESRRPAAYYTLSELGLQEATRFSNDLYRYPELDSYRVNQQQIRHYLIAQSATLNGLHLGEIIHYETERMFFPSGDKAGMKRPDVVWHTQTGTKIGVEIELSAKWGKDLDKFVLDIERALESTQNKPASYNRFAIISDSKAIIDRYRTAMQPSADLSIWKKNQRHHWVVDKTISIPSWLIGKIDFHLIEG